MLTRKPPSSVLSAGLAVALLLFFSAVYIATHVPWLGFTTVPGEHGVRISRVDALGPAGGALAIGDELLAIRSGTQVLLLEPGDALAEPDDVPRYDLYNRFFQRQALLWELLNQPGLEFQVAGSALEEAGEALWVSLMPQPARGLRHLPFLFWYQVGCGLAIFLMGVSTWAFVQSERGPFYYALAGLAIALAIMTSAIYTTRELGLHPDLFLTLSRLNQFGAMLFAGAGTTLLWYYPTRLFRCRFEWLMFPAVGLILFANWGQWVDSLDLTARYPLLGWCLIDVVLAGLQWRRSRGEPVEQARLKWFVYAWFAGVIGYLAIVILPQIVGLESLLHQSHAWIFFVISYLGIALGIVRYRLFDLDRWVLLAWFWFAFGVLFIALDAVLVMALQVETAVGLLIALAVAGWVYLPIRQAFMQWLMPKEKSGALHQRLPDILQQAFMHERSVDEQWVKAMQEIFAPLSLEPSNEYPSKPLIRDNGLRLAVPALDNSGGYILGYASGGNRLFDRQDETFCTQALMLFQFARQYHQSFQSGVMTERKRVARDLHDDVGARLLSVVYKAQGSDELQQLARDSLRELREVIQGLQKDAVPIEQSFARWQAEARERCELFGLTLSMQLDSRLGEQQLSPRIERNLSKTLRECLTNSFKHAQAKDIHVRITSEKGLLTLNYQDNGSGLTPDSADGQSGLGIPGIQQRCEELGGYACWWSPADGGCGVYCEIPLRGKEVT